MKWRAFPIEKGAHVFATGRLPIGVVDVKLCAIDAAWSGLKLVVRKELR